MSEINPKDMTVNEMLIMLDKYYDMQDDLNKRIKLLEHNITVLEKTIFLKSFEMRKTARK